MFLVCLQNSCQYTDIHQQSNIHPDLQIHCNSYGDWIIHIDIYSKFQKLSALMTKQHWQKKRASLRQTMARMTGNAVMRIMETKLTTVYRCWNFQNSCPAFTLAMQPMTSAHFTFFQAIKLISYQLTHCLLCRPSTHARHVYTLESRHTLYDLQPAYHTHCTVYTGRSRNWHRSMRWMDLYSEAYRSWN